MFQWLVWTLITFSRASEFVVWNVGQGLWTTEVQEHECWHFDLGGENFKMIGSVEKSCGQKMNRIFLSHWDLDHINFLPQIRKKHWALCLAQGPSNPAPKSKAWIIQGLQPCPSPNKVRRRFSGLGLKKSNEQSQVFESLISKALIPGDSGTKEEKTWAPRLSVDLRVLILGHHGSRTSTSEELLNHLPRLQMAVASARASRYGHPHREVITRLQKHKIPLLKTEDWGTLHFQNSN